MFNKSKEELKNLALQGKLVWENKKVILDPFTPAEVIFHIEKGDEKYHVEGFVRIGTSETKTGKAFENGFLEHLVFRFWKNEIWSEWVGKTLLLDLPQLKKWFDDLQKDPDHPVLIWKCPIPKWKPDPFPILILKDRTGGFADLWMDYGPFGREPYNSTVPEELFWEKDLLETDFIKKQVGNSAYYCPMDKVVKSLSFLLDIGWTLLDFQGKKVVRQGISELKTETDGQNILVRGSVVYEHHKADIKDVVGAFNRREKFLNLSSSEVGLIDFPSAWVDLAEEEMTTRGIAVKRQHVGLLEEIVPIPPEYRAASWENIQPESTFQGKLFDYQQEGLKWLSYLFRSGFSGLLADEMGLGKTIQVIAFLSTLDLKIPLLIVMPVSLLFHWKKEIEKFLPHLHVHMYAGESFSQESGVILTSYARLRQDRMFFESMKFTGIILDEASNIKNADTWTAQICCRLQAPFKLALTGTPIENRFEDLWSIFRFLMPELLGEKKESYVMERVRKKIRPFTLRRTKKDVDLQLPEKLEQIVWIQMGEEQQAFYEQYLKQRRSALHQKVQSQGLSSQRMEILELILRLRQICCHPTLVSGEYPSESAKFQQVCNDLKDVVSAGHKVLLYSQFTSVLTLFKNWLRENDFAFAYLDGETRDREKVVESFQNDQSIQIFLMSLKAGGVGLNLQAADYVFLYDPWWNIAVEQQATSRAHRVGRKEKVIARKYLVAESIEEKILKLQSHKHDLSKNLLDFDENTLPISLEELYALLNV